MDSIEKLYKNFAILADSKDKIGEVNFIRMYLKMPGFFRNCAALKVTENIFFFNKIFLDLGL